MSFLPEGKSLVVTRGSILEAKVEAIVNAANQSLMGGGGVDGVIHRAAGPKLKEYCRGIGGCAPGSAKITPAFDLNFKSIIHAVGPVWKGGNNGEERLLASAYRSAMLVADENQLCSVAFPSISTGAYSYPISEAVPVALSTVHEMLATTRFVHAVAFYCIDRQTYSAFDRTLDRLRTS